MSVITVRKSGMMMGSLLKDAAYYLLWYAKGKDNIKYRQLLSPKEAGLGAGEMYSMLECRESGERRRLTDGERADPTSIPSGWRAYRLMTLATGGYRLNTTIAYTFGGNTYHPGTDRCWRTTVEGLNRLSALGRIESTASTLNYKAYVDDFPCVEVTNIWTDTGTGGSEGKVYAVQTPAKVIQRCVLMTTDPGDLVLDPTCGSGTAAYVAEQWGRRWITCDTSRVALTLARTRLMAGRYPYYLLADSPEGLKREAELTGKLPPEYKTEGDVKKGFVYKRVPHVTLKSIANNEEIDEIHARWQQKLDPVREKLNRLLDQEWEEWELPREAEPSWPQEARDLLARWWEMRRERQKDIDDSIARRADTETLYDQPCEDPRRIRVTGPFTVESLSPHRTLSVDEKIARAEGTSEALPGMRVRVLGPDDFGRTIIDNLKKAGVQNTKKNERLKFDTLEPFAGEWLQAAGEYTDSSGATRRVAVALGPEHGTVGPELVKEAAKEAIRGVGFDLLVVCGFAFDAHAGETAKEFSPNGPSPADGFAVADGTRQYGMLPVLLARMNPDLAMGDELLKKTGAGNLFMVFGEPDIAIERQQDGKIILEIRGVDVYDPTTGDIRSSSTDDIACWFVDTDYNGESFFVRHAYFTGADEPYEKLKRALRAEVDETAWSSLYSTRSRPFEPPKTGKVAVKVINHYGDEVLKVFSL